MKARDYFGTELQIRFAESVARGDEKRMRALLKQGADVNAVGRLDMRPLFWALCKQSIKGFQFLLENGADPNITATLEGETVSVMELTALMENPEYLRLALKQGGDPNTRMGTTKDTVIYEAIMHHRIGNVQILIAAGANVNHQGNSGETPIITAGAINQYDIVHLLLKAGADPSIKDRWGWDRIERFASRTMKPENKQYEWYLKVIQELKRQKLME